MSYVCGKSLVNQILQIPVCKSPFRFWVEGI